jgi:ABC-type glutathione transport system ATPase component
VSSEPLIVADRLRKVFPRRGRWPDAVAVDDVSLELQAGGSLAIVGESGAGKTTVARMLLGLETPTSGRIVVDGRVLRRGRVSTPERRRRAREIQIVFQDPYTSLDPRQRVGACLDEVLRLHFSESPAARRESVRALLEQVGLSDRYMACLPRSLSGGQRQRVVIARALAARPRILVLDEAVSALDVSIKGQILNLLADIRDSNGVSYIFISHDLGVIRQITSEAIVMRRGQVVERGPTAQILDAPQHPYTRLLRGSVPGPGWEPRNAERTHALSLLEDDYLPEGAQSGALERSPPQSSHGSSQ